MTLLLGAVAYDPKVVSIWTGFRDWFLRHDLPFDYVLYSHYERQVEDLLSERIQVAWNSPLAWVRAERLAETSGAPVEAIAMRDSDRDLTSVVVVRSDAPIQALKDLSGRVVGVGAVDSPQATLIPLSHLARAGLEPGRDIQVRRFDVGVGLHGDHIGGERDAARALLAGEVDAACMIDGNHLLFTREGTLPAGSTRILTQTGRYDHCNMSVGPGTDREQASQFAALLAGQSYADPAVRELMDLEGLKEWCDGRTSGYALLTEAVDRFAFYDRQGAITADGYTP